jgi:hypothetical protein
LPAQVRLQVYDRPPASVPLVKMLGEVLMACWYARGAARYDA